MNKRDRKELEALREQLENVRMRLEEFQEAEQDKADNLLGTNLEESERCQLFVEAADQLAEVVSLLEDAASQLDDVVAL